MRIAWHPQDPTFLVSHHQVDKTQHYIVLAMGDGMESVNLHIEGYDATSAANTRAIARRLETAAHDLLAAADAIEAALSAKVGA